MQSSISWGPLTSGDPFLVEDAAKDETAPQWLAALKSFGPAMFVPLRSRVAPATLTVARVRDRPAFGPTELDLLQAFGVQAALGLEFLRAQRDRDTLLMSEDRSRIGRDLHDRVIQRLFATGMGLEAATRLIESHEGRARVVRAVDELDVTIRDIRSSIFGLEEQAQATSLRGQGPCRPCPQAGRCIPDGCFAARPMRSVDAVDAPTATEVATVSRVPSPRDYSPP